MSDDKDTSEPEDEYLADLDDGEQRFRAARRQLGAISASQADARAVLDRLFLGVSQNMRKVERVIEDVEKKSCAVPDELTLVVMDEVRKTWLSFAIDLRKMLREKAGLFDVF